MVRSASCLFWLLLTRIIGCDMVSEQSDARYVVEEHLLQRLQQVASVEEQLEDYPSSRLYVLSSVQSDSLLAWV
ncbi:hypothetical protein KIN20_031713 [Parelaphostrongylus tenuis]|uniref:Uncharacterized protein n=1 Tax=Parelaphostrongylus tenuis TaxID=148309 RepID=A0AAD5R5X1_PARTN|nr:hypothetical protein KIN20_031713 [Parelaphostrongylus tenuis]